MINLIPLIEKIPIIDLLAIFPLAWEKMTPDERAELLKNALIIGAKTGAAIG